MPSSTRSTAAPPRRDRWSERCSDGGSPDARRPHRPPRRRSASDLYLTGWALLLTKGFPAGTDLLRDAMRLFRDDPQPDELEIWGLWQGAADVAKALLDDETWFALAGRWVGHAREAGALPALSAALRSLGDIHLYAGEFAAAAPLFVESVAITEATGAQPSPTRSCCSTPGGMARRRRRTGSPPRSTTRSRARWRRRRTPSGTTARGAIEPPWRRRSGRASTTPEAVRATS